VPVLLIGGALVLVPCVLLTLVDAGRRVWRGRSPEREQLLWLLLATVVAVVGSYLPLSAAQLLLHLLVPVAVAVGVVRHQLLDLQVVVRRTLLFAGLTGCVVVAFVTSTALLGEAFGGDTVPVALAAALVAVGLTPVRELLQRGVDRLVHGERGDPLRAVVTLGREVAEQDDALLVPQVLRSVAAAVRSPHVVLLDPDGLPVAEAGTAAPGAPLRLPLQVGGRSVGSLDVTPRTARDGWSDDDHELLDLLARQVAVVAHAGRLNAELARSRDRVVQATAEERQRLHQELHDGLGPTLSGIALGLEAAEAALERSPERAAVLLGRLRAETQSAGREVRRLVEGLRPAALDRQGLEVALADFVDGLRDTAAGRLDVDLELPDVLPPLCPDTDAAAYRIVTEAVTNVVRHSGAGHCRVAVTVEPAGLRLLVEDDGNGLPAQPRDGVGLVSMRRRTAGLGGTWSAGPRPGGGTRVEVLLPTAYLPAQVQA
jgi:signal transduction histidine kinase